MGCTRMSRNTSTLATTASLRGVAIPDGAGRVASPADWYLAIIFTIRDGKIVRGEEYFDRAEALEAAGLSE